MSDIKSRGDAEVSQEWEQAKEEYKQEICADESRAEIPFFRFVLRFSDEDLNKVIKEVANIDIITCIVHARIEIKQKFYNALSMKARTLLRQDVEIMRFSLRRSEGRAAQLRFLKRAREMSKRGELTSGVWK
jgi:flagellar motor switch protein FliG